jgi:hypothetical protein
MILIIVIVIMVTGWLLGERNGVDHFTYCIYLRVFFRKWAFSQSPLNIKKTLIVKIVIIMIIIIITMKVIIVIVVIKAITVASRMEIILIIVMIVTGWW